MNFHKRLTFDQRRQAIRALRSFRPGIEIDPARPGRPWSKRELLAAILTGFFLIVSLVTLGTYYLGKILLHTQTTTP